jgi:hypothetical protein
MDHVMHEGAVIKSGCGQTIYWSSMRKVDPSDLQELGLIELEKPVADEQRFKSNFDRRMRHFEKVNKGVLDQAGKSKIIHALHAKS